MDSPCDDNGQEVWTSQMIVAPAFVDAAAKDLATIGSAISRANAEALVPITALLPAGADDVSAAIAALFATHGQAYQELSAHAVAFHEQFVQLMSAGAAQYASAEAANSSPLQIVGQTDPRCHQFTRADADRASAYRQRRLRWPNLLCIQPEPPFPPAPPSKPADARRKRGQRHSARGLPP